MRAADSNNDNYWAKVSPDQSLYKETVAEPVMSAVDAMPPEYRQLVHEFGYVNIYLAWRRAWSVKEIRERAKALGGRFSL